MEPGPSLAFLGTVLWYQPVAGLAELLDSMPVIEDFLDHSSRGHHSQDCWAGGWQDPGGEQASQPCRNQGGLHSIWLGCTDSLGLEWEG